MWGAHRDSYRKQRTREPERHQRQPEAIAEPQSRVCPSKTKTPEARAVPSSSIMSCLQRCLPTVSNVTKSAPTAPSPQSTITVLSDVPPRLVAAPSYMEDVAMLPPVETPICTSSFERRSQQLAFGLLRIVAHDREYHDDDAIPQNLALCGAALARREPLLVLYDFGAARLPPLGLGHKLVKICTTWADANARQWDEHVQGIAIVLANPLVRSFAAMVTKDDAAATAHLMVRHRGRGVCVPGQHPRRPLLRQAARVPLCKVRTPA